jgi:hypothetical protein
MARRESSVRGSPRRLKCAQWRGAVPAYHEENVAKTGIGRPRPTWVTTSVRVCTKEAGRTWIRRGKCSQNRTRASATNRSGYEGAARAQPRCVVPVYCEENMTKNGIDRLRLTGVATCAGGVHKGGAPCLDTLAGLGIEHPGRPRELRACAVEARRACVLRGEYSRNRNQTSAADRGDRSARVGCADRFTATMRH